MKVLFCSTGLAGHFNPLVPLIDAARARGDQVLVVVPPSLVSVVQELGLSHLESEPPDPTQSKELWKRAARVPHREATKLLDGEFFGRLTTAAMLPAVASACDSFKPDVILREPCAYAGAVVGVRRSIPHAQVAISTAQTEWSVIDLVAPILDDFESECERCCVRRTTSRGSPRASTRRRSPIRFDTAKRRTTTTRGATPRGPRPRCRSSTSPSARSLGVSTRPRRPFAGRLEAVEGLGVQVLLTTGHGFDRKLLGPLPEDVYVEPWVPQEQVFPHATAVLCHGGSGTTYGALAAALPIVFVPMFADQRTNARLIAVAGAGIVVDVGRKSEPGFRTIEVEDVPRIRRAVTEILAQRIFRDSAQRIANEIRGTGSAQDCLHELEKLTH
jgi:UDP:flavonoid glycosyltransferase YjiC (YdhE family)